MKSPVPVKKRIQWQQLLSEFNKSLSLITDIYQLKDNVAAKIRDLVDVKKVLIFLLNEELNNFIPIERNSSNSHWNNSNVFTPSDKLIFWLDVNRTYLLCLESPEIIHFLSEKERKSILSLEVIFIYPLIVMNKVKGMVMLGEKNNGEPLREDELDILKTFLNQAAFAFENALMYQQQKERVRRMYRADRLATLGQLAAGAAHEIRNPLTSIRSTIQYLQNKMVVTEDREMLKDIVEEVDRINEIISGLLSLSKTEKPVKEKVNLKENIQQIINLVSNSARKRSIGIILNYDTDQEIIFADQGQLKQMMLNVIMNAIQSISHDHGKISIHIFSDRPGADKNLQEGNYLIEITDNGQGIQVDSLERIFDPFYTTKEDGTGLGLSITYGIIHKHNGDIEIESDEGKGTKVKIKLPVHK